MARQQVLLAVSELPAASGGAACSREARRLLSQLAAAQGFICPEADWSPRGSGPPTHPRLPSGWFAGITHKRGAVIAGLSDGPWGIDLECFNPRHALRLEGLIDSLPEPPVRKAIHEAGSPQLAFYQAWTLYEALFKLAGHTDRPAPSVFDVRLPDPLKSEDTIRVWQGQEWTLTLAGEAPVLLNIDPASILCGIAPVASLFFKEVARHPIADNQISSPVEK